MQRVLQAERAANTEALSVQRTEICPQYGWSTMSMRFTYHFTWFWVLLLN